MKPLIKLFIPCISAIICLIGIFANPGYCTETDGAKTPSMFASEYDYYSYRLQEGLPLTEAEKERYVEFEPRHPGDDRGSIGSLDNQGGPDAFQYMFRDNVAPDDVPYEWIELRDDPDATWIGGLAFFTSHDDGYSRQKLPIGFPFPFYGVPYDCVRVASNGFLQFTTTSGSLGNACLPSTAVAGPMIAVFWDDLNMTRGGRADTITVGYRNFGDYFVIEYDGIGFHTTSCPNVPLKFEAILYLNGDIKLQYNTITRPAATCQNSQSIGIQQAGAAGSSALTYICNATGIVPDDGLAILFARASGIPRPCTELTAVYADPNVELSWTDPTTDTQNNPITIENVEVWLGGVETGHLLATVPAGVRNYTHVNAPIGNLTYSIRPYLNPYYGSSISVPIMVGTPGYSNDFNTGGGGWVPSPATGGWEWGTPWGIANLIPHSAPSLWGTVVSGNYANSACWQLDLDSGFVVTSDAATVEFWHWFNSQATYDGCNFKASVDNGATWTVLTPTSGGYNLASLNAATACMGLQPAWAGTTPLAWQYAVIPIGQFIGQVPIFRFEFSTNATTNNLPGFYFDDMTIWGVSAQQTGIPQPCTNLVGTYNAPNVNLTWNDPILDTENNPLTPDYVQVWFGAAGSGTLLGTVSPGVQSYTHLNAPIGIQTYSIRPVHGTFFGAPISVNVTVGTPGYINNFETDDGQWIADPPAGGWEWGTPTLPPTLLPHSGNNVWGTLLTANYANNACYTLTLATTLTVTSPTATVEFWQWFYTETLHDGANFQISLDQGSTWTLVTPTGGYPGTAGTTTACIPSQPYWAGLIGVWNYSVIPIGEFIGQTVMLRFVFGADASVVYPGFFFDDLIIWGAGQPAGIPNPCTNMTGTYTAPNVGLTWTDPTLDVQGNPLTVDSVQIWLGAAGTGTRLGSVNAGVQSFTHLNAPQGIQTYTLRPVNDSYFGATVSVNVVVGNPGYVNDFNTTDGGWVSTGGWEWGAPTNTAAPVPHSSPNYWGTGLTANYGANACFQLDLTSGLVVTSPTAYVEFWFYYDSQLNYDGCNFKASNDNGASWTILTPTEGVYNSTALNAANVCMGGQPAWSNITPRTWQRAVIPVGQYLGQSLSFRFEFSSNATTHYSGFFFDDLIMWGLENAVGVPQPCTNLNGSYVTPNAVLTWTDPTLDTQGSPLTIDSVQIWQGAAGTGTLLAMVNQGVQTYTHANPPTGILTYTVRPKHDSYLGAPTSTQITVGNPSYVNDFNTENGGWVPEPATGGWAWGEPTNTSAPVPHSDPSYWSTCLTANYGNTVDYKLDFSPGLLVQSPNATVEFWYRFDTELNFDGCNFKASIDGGTTWTVLTPTTGLYTITAISTTNTFMAGQPAWSGHTQTQWQYTIIPIGELAGQTPIFRFEFSSDASASNYFGFCVDDMIIWGMQPPSGITGEIRSFGNNLPLANARVWIEGVTPEVFSDSTGNYLLPVDPGTYSVTFDHDIYCDSTVNNVVVVEGGYTPRNMFLRAPHGQLSVTSVSLETFVGVATQDTFFITNTNGQCPLEFTIADTSTWLTVDPDTGAVNPNQTVNIILHINPTGLPVGDYSSVIVVDYKDADAPRNLRVDLSIGVNPVDPNELLPTEFAYYQNFPNPFNASTSIRFDVPKASWVKIAIYNVLGQEVVRPVDKEYAPGRYSLQFNASELSSGMYFVRMTAGDYTQKSKMMLIK